MNEIAEQLKRQFEKNHYQSLYRAQCECGRFAKIVMSNYVTSGNLYAILFCKRCNKFLFHSGGSCLEVWGEVTYHGHLYDIEYGSEKWNRIVKQIEAGDIFEK